MPMPITLVLANHQPIVLHGLTQLFAREQDFFVLASHTNSAETLESMRRHRPAVLVLGVSAPATEGLTVLREMQEENLPTRAVVFAEGGIDEQEIVEAIRLGAHGVVLKEMAPRLLLGSAYARCTRAANGSRCAPSATSWGGSAKATQRATEPRR